MTGSMVDNKEEGVKQKHVLSLKKKKMGGLVQTVEVRTLSVAKPRNFQKILTGCLTRVL